MGVFSVFKLLGILLIVYLLHLIGINVVEMIVGLIVSQLALLGAILFRFPKHPSEGSEHHA